MASKRSKSLLDPKDSSLVWLLELETAVRAENQEQATKARKELSRLGIIKIEIDRAVLMRRTARTVPGCW